MKRMICTFGMLAMLTWTCAPTHAEYRGVLKRDQEWFLNVDNSTTCCKTAITIHFYGNRFEDIDFRTVAGGPEEGRVRLPFSKPGRHVTRMLIEVDPPSEHTEVRVAVEQNGSSSATFIGYGRMVFEVE